MKKTFIASALILGSLASFTAQARDPCKSLVCMAGKAGVAGGSQAGDCSQAVNDFFSIIVTKKGKFKPDPTATKRLQFLESCQGHDAVSENGSNPEALDKIISKFGRVRSS
ncbi:TPA: hypothetical protein ACIRVE_005104 [Pseudomonas putida]